MTTKRIIPGFKNDNGVYVREPAKNEPAPLTSPQATPKETIKDDDISIDELFKRGLLAIHRLMSLINQEIVMGMPERDTVANLKDCMSMLETLKKREQDLLDKMSDDELEEYNKTL